MIGIIDNNKEIERFVKQLDIKSWNDMEQLPEDIDLVYSYISYEVIDEPLFLQDGKQLVHKSTLELYISDKGEYIIRDYDQEIETIARISEKAGRFLNAPEDLDLNKNITAKDILDGWGLDFYVPNSNIESDIEKTDDIENARYYEGDTSFTEKELRKTSEEQKIQFYGADKNTLLNEIDDISEIAQYLNGLTLNRWEYADDAPNPEEVECQIVRFMLSRHSIKKELKEMYTQILYKSDGNYYIEEIIPGEYSDRGEFITHYQVSEEIAKYILSNLVSASMLANQEHQNQHESQSNVNNYAENGLPGLEELEPLVDDKWPVSVSCTTEKTTAKNLSFDIQIDEPMVIVVSCVTESGKISMQIKDINGNKLFDEKNMKTETFEVTIDKAGTYTVTIEAENHTGSFRISPKIN